MRELAERIRRDAKHLGKGIIKVDSFMNHQVDAVLMKKVGAEFAHRFAGARATKVLTAETSGIAPALACAIELQVPLIFARKHEPLTMAADPYRETTVSPTHQRVVDLMVSHEYLHATDRVLIIDDFLASAQTILALARLVEKSGARLVGIGAVIEKQYSQGRTALSSLDVPIESLAVIVKAEKNEIVLA